MKSLRLRMLVGVTLATGVAAGASFMLLRGHGDAAAMIVLGVHAALLVVLTLLVWWATSAREKALLRLAEFLRALSIGRQDARLELVKYGDLEDVARAANEIAAAQAERDDPTVGSVKSKKREGPITLPTPEPARVGRLPSFPLRPLANAPVDESAATAGTRESSGDVESSPRPKRGSSRGGDSQHPEIGPVRVIKRRAKDEPVADQAVVQEPKSSSGAAPSSLHTPAPPAEVPPIEAATPVADAPPAGAVADETSRAVPPDEASSSSRSHIDVLPAREIDSAPHARPQSATSSIDTAPKSDAVSEPLVDDERASNTLRSGDPNDTTIDDAPVAVTIPTTAADDERVQLRALFDEYILTKKAHDEPVVDLEFEAFATALSEERLKLIDAHRCRDVRFEIKVQGGEVSLLPRLIR